MVLPALPRSILLRLPLKYTPIITCSTIILPQNPVLRPNQQIQRQPLQDPSSPSKRITKQSLPFMCSGEIVKVNTTLLTSIILRKEVLELLRSEASLGVVSIAITPMLAVVYVVEIDSEPEVGEVVAGR